MINFKLVFRILLNTLIGVVLIYFWFKLVNINEILQSLEKLNPWSLIPIFILIVLANVIRSVRLTILLSEFKVKFKNIALINFLSQLLSFTIPIRAGEIAKSVYLSTEYKIPFAKTIILIFLDRFLDFFVVIFLSAIFLQFIPTNLPQSLPLVFGVLALVLVLGLIFAIALPKVVGHIAKFIHIKLITQMSEFVVGSTAFLREGFLKTISLFGLSIIAGFLEALSWYLLFIMLENNVDFIKIWLGSMLSALTYLIPAAPGYVGSAEASGLAVFSLGLGMDRTYTAAVTIVLHALSLVYMLIFGVGSLYLLKFDLKLVWKKIRKQEE